MKIAIVSATSDLAQATALKLASVSWPTQNVEFYLSGRNLDGLNAVAADLEIRNPSIKTKVSVLDMLDGAQINKYVSELPTIDIALIAQGELTDQQSAQADPQVLKRSLDANLISPTLFANAFSEKFEFAKAGHLALIGSVAGDRGRKSNYIYGAAKSFAETLVQGINHRFAGTSASALLIKPGPTRTKMTLAMANTPKRLADPHKSAAAIAKAMLANKRGVLYVPRSWGLVMLIIRFLPAAIFNRLDI